MKLLMLGGLLMSVNFIFAQNRYVSGNIKDENGDPLPYTNIIITGTSQGTSANYDGEYLLELPAGKYSLSFQFIGYERQVHEVDLASEDYKLDITLREETLSLKEVVINSNGEDPAYDIIRKAQKVRRKYLDEFYGFEHRAYTKIFAEADQSGYRMSLFGTELESEPGVFYLSESFARVRKAGPEARSETLIASLVSGDTSSYSANKVRVIDFYRNRTLKANAVEFVSPIANDAMSYYDYEFEGYFTENEQLINKIRLIPKNSSAPAYTGHIYIIEDSWRIYGVHAFAAQNTNAVGDLELKVAYTRLAAADRWVPFSVDFFISTAIGIDAFYHAVQFDFDFDLSDKPAVPAGLRYQIADSARIMEPDYWKKNRPIPLTDDERETYKRDSLFRTQVKINPQVSAAKEDSVVNDLRSGGMFVYGVFNERSYQLSDRWQLTTDPYISHVNFNTVEGLVLGYRSTLKHTPANNNVLTITPEIRYGFSSKRFYGKVDVSRELDPLKPAKITFSGGSFVQQISGFESIRPFENTIYSLLEGQNYLKLYEQNYASLTYRKELFNGFDLTVSTGYADRSPLGNSTNFTLVADDERNYTPNVAVVDEVPVSFESNVLLKYGLTVSYSIARPYNLYPDRKEILTTQRPVIKAAYEAGRGDSDYQLLWGNASDAWTFGVVGTSTLSVSYGKFIDDETVFITDYFHFAGNQTAFMNRRERYGLSFQLLDYYHMSTDREFFGGNYEHDFNSTIIGKIPLLNKSKASLAVSAGYLNSPGAGNYFEAGVQLKHIFQFIDFGYYQSYLNGDNIRNGFTIGASVNIR